MKLSIVTAYHNRKPQFIKTLESIGSSVEKDIEVVVVDDASDKEHRLEDIVGNYTFPIKLIRTEKKERWYKNPCIPFNKAISESTGDIIILQNPECLHLGDVVKSSLDLIKDGYYLVFNCYSLSKEISETFLSTGAIPNNLPNKPMYDEGDIGWYHHPQIRPVYYHFCSAITRKDMLKLGCFDKKYAHGLGYDDDDLIRKIRNSGLNVLSLVSGPMVVHQYHYHTGNLTREEKIRLSLINKEIFDKG